MTQHDGFPCQPIGAAGLHQQWYDANASAGRLTAQRCECGRWRMPARYRCASCHGEAWSFEPVGDHGRVVGWTVTHRPFHFGFAQVVPYAMVIAEVPEGIRVLLHVRPSLTDIGGDIDWHGREVVIAVDEFGLPYASLVG